MRISNPVETFLAIGLIGAGRDLSAVLLAVPLEHLVLYLCEDRFAGFTNGPFFNDNDLGMFSVILIKLASYTSLLTVTQ